MNAFRRLLSATTLLFAVASPAVFAQAFTEGKDYFRIEPVQPTATPGKVEVLEVFSYGCGACATVHPHVEAWKKNMPANAAFSYMPATFRPDFALLARGYYAAEALGLLESTHARMFEAVRTKGRFASIEDVADVYAGLGADRAAFLAAANSFAVNAKVKRVTQALPRYGVDSTPSFVVAGKFRVTGPAAGSYERLFQIIDFLVASEAAAAGR